MRLASAAREVAHALIELRRGDGAAPYRLAHELAASLGPTELRCVADAARLALGMAPPLGWNREAWARVAAEAWR